LVFLGHGPDKEPRSPWGAISYVVEQHWRPALGASKDAFKRRLLAAVSGDTMTVPSLGPRRKETVYWWPISDRYQHLEIAKALLTPAKIRRGVVLVSGPDVFGLRCPRRKRLKSR
jgi:hypothetical protein